MKRQREEGPPGPAKKPDPYVEAEKKERLTTHDGERRRGPRALSYLREVKTRFANNRKVYDSFLEIMKQFKSQMIDTQGVIDKVKELFKGHPELILGFNTFLPKARGGGGARRRGAQRPQRARARRAPTAADTGMRSGCLISRWVQAGAGGGGCRRGRWGGRRRRGSRKLQQCGSCRWCLRRRLSVGQLGGCAAVGPRLERAVGAAGGDVLAAPRAPPRAAPSATQAVTRRAARAARRPRPRPPAQQQSALPAAPAPKQPVEFDQAITYVNKIKQRFASDERVYKAFLEILNMYRKGQKTIANVYEEVALLFRNHEDLLREFTYFLPDNTPPLGAGAAARRGPGAAAAAGYGRKAGGAGYRATRKAGPNLRKGALGGGSRGAMIRTLLHSFLETLFEVQCTCGEAEERRRAAGGSALSPAQARRGRKKAAAAAAAGGAGAGAGAGSEPSSAVEGTEAMELDAATEENGAQATGDGKQETGAETEDSEEEEGAAATSMEPSAALSEEDEADESAFAACKPVVPLTAGGAAAAAAAPPPPPSPDAEGVLHPHCRVLYGNEQLYVLLRLHRHLYERLLTARTCSMQKGNAASFSTLDSAASSAGQWTPAAAGVHGEFLGMVTRLVEGRLDPSDYEDDCRALLGTSSYQLFTLDKLVQKVVKQMQLVLADETSARLVELWKYENTRGVPVRARCILEPAFHEYVKSYVDSSAAAPGAAAPDAEGAARVCLARNLAGAAGGGGGAPDADAEGAALAACQLVNGLECKLCNTQQKVKKIAYVLGTEDFFYRRRQPPAGAGAGGAKRAERFQAWLAKVAPPLPVAA
eukprot:scaffold2.g7276.t1